LIDKRLEIAIKNFSLYKVKALLRNGVSFNTINPPLFIVLEQWNQCVCNKYSPIRHYYDSLIMLKDLLDNNADPNVTFHHPRFQYPVSACEYALYIGCLHGLSILLEHKGIVTDEMVRYCLYNYSGPHYDYAISLLSDYTDKLEEESGGWCNYIINESI